MSEAVIVASAVRELTLVVIGFAILIACMLISIMSLLERIAVAVEDKPDAPR